MGQSQGLAELGGSSGTRGHHQPHAKRPLGAAASSHTPSASLCVRDEQANPILIPDYVPREPLPEAGCSVAIRAVQGGGPGVDPPPIQEL